MVSPLRLMLSLAVVLSCSSVNDVPLGGPYGGTTEPTPPTEPDGGYADASSEDVEVLPREPQRPITLY